MNADPHKSEVKTYLLGFFLSVVLTLAAYFLVVTHVLVGRVLSVVLLGLGVTQALIQLFCFLHLGRERKPRWNLLTFLFMLVVLLVLVIGSMFIMYSLNYRLME